MRTIQQEDACQVIVNCLIDRDVQLHVAITNGHASNQTSFALDGGFDAARKAMTRFAGRSNKMNTYVSFWARMLDNAINGKAVNIHDCQFFKCEYEDDDEEDENWGDLPGEKASEVIPEMIGIILNEASEYLIYRLSAATCVQRIIRGVLCRIQNKELISEIMAKIKALQESREANTPTEKKGKKKVGKVVRAKKERKDVGHQAGQKVRRKNQELRVRPKKVDRKARRKKTDR